MRRPAGMPHSVSVDRSATRAWGVQLMSVPIVTKRMCMVATLALATVTTSLLAGCGLFDQTTEAVIAVDSVSVSAPTAPSNSAQLTFHGTVGFNSCSQLDRVERRSVGADTLSWRFVAKRDGGAVCLQAPVVMAHGDSVANLPARTIVIRVEQPAGAPFLRTLQLPLSEAP